MIWRYQLSLPHINFIQQATTGIKRSLASTREVRLSPLQCAMGWFGGRLVPTLPQALLWPLETRAPDAAHFFMHVGNIGLLALNRFTPAKTRGHGANIVIYFKETKKIVIIIYEKNLYYYTFAEYSLFLGSYSIAWPVELQKLSRNALGQTNFRPKFVNTVHSFWKNLLIKTKLLALNIDKRITDFKENIFLRKNTFH